jgi:hypothetical protein
MWILDRLAAPNDDATLEALRPDLDAVLGSVYAGAEAAVERIRDPKEPFTLRVTLSDAPPLEELARRLGAR